MDIQQQADTLDGALTVDAEATSDPKPQVPTMTTTLRKGYAATTTEAWDTLLFAATTEARDAVSDLPQRAAWAKASRLLAERVRGLQAAKRGFRDVAVAHQATGNDEGARVMSEMVGTTDRIQAEAARCWTIVLGLYGDGQPQARLNYLDLVAVAIYQADLADWLERHQD